MLSKSETIALLPESERFKALTDRQLEVLRLIAVGYNLREIAEKKKARANTLQRHKNRAFKTLGICCPADATCYALKYGLIAGTVSVNFAGVAKLANATGLSPVSNAGSIPATGTTAG